MRRSRVAYGAFELKQSYQGHLAWGIAIGALLHIVAIFSFTHFTHQGAAGNIPIESPTDGRVIVFPDEVFEEDLSPVNNRVTNPPLPPDFGRFEPAPDEEIASAYIPPIWEHGPVGPEGQGTDSGTGTGQRESFGGPETATGGYEAEPLPGAFVAVEFQPVCVKPVPPEFPEIARLTGREGKVVVRALVDIDGTVRRAEIVRTSGVNVGFDEAAIAAALECHYKPAIQNGRPVMVWVTYAVEFKLR